VIYGRRGKSEPRRRLRGGDAELPDDPERLLTGPQTDADVFIGGIDQMGKQAVAIPGSGRGPQRRPVRGARPPGHKGPSFVGTKIENEPEADLADPDEKRDLPHQAFHNISRVSLDLENPRNGRIGLQKRPDAFPD